MLLALSPHRLSRLAGDLGRFLDRDAFSSIEGD
jgi:hypothetical protein